MKRIFWFFIFNSCCLFTRGQSVANYVLVPGYSFILPVDEKLPLSIQWIDDKGNPHFGTNDFRMHDLLPDWTINGQQSNANNPEGNLSVDLSFAKAVYTAPSRIPVKNPVLVAVKFPANDTTKEMVTLICRIEIVNPANKWYITYNCSESNTSTITSVNRQFSDERHAIGNGSMLVKSGSADPSGYVLINTGEDDTLEKYTVSGTSSERISDISKNTNGEIEEKTMRNYSGKPDNDKNRNGIEFEYDPAPGGVKGLAASGITFNITGTDEFWKMDENTGQLKKITNDVNEEDANGILMGSSEDKITKSKDGFTIDFSMSKDTSYTDFTGEKHTNRSTKQYHMTLSRKKSKSVSQNEINKYNKKRDFISIIKYDSFTMAIS